MLIEKEGGVCAADGFTSAGIHCGIRKNKTKKDLALIVSDRRAAAACVYTSNLVKGAAIQVTRAHTADGFARAIVCNSGNANTCNADGVQKAQEMCDIVAAAAGIPASDVIPASTGVIGLPFDTAPIRDAMPALVGRLGTSCTDANLAIMTTDTIPKNAAFEFRLGETVCHIGGIAKGSGMIHPNLATMLVFITTDAAVSPAMLKRALDLDVPDSFNMVSVDGDTSTNDMVCLLANGAAGNEEITGEDDNFLIFREALSAVTTKLCRLIAKDGEGASKLIVCNVTGAKDKQTAKTAAKSVICSNLTKAAMFGADANWGRVLCALGYSGADLNISAIDVTFTSSAGSVDVCKNGSGIDFSEEQAKKVLTEDEIDIDVSVGDGGFSASAWGCDLTYDYVKINGDYRT